MTPSALLLLQAIATGSVTGTLRDATSGNPLSGVRIALLDLNRTVVTDADGRYLVTRLPAGVHRLLVRRIGYAPRAVDALIPADDTVEIAIELRAEPVVLDPVEGGGGQSDEPTLAFGRRVDVGSLRNHPLLAEPDAFQALGGGVVALQPESPAGMHIRGGASDQVTYLLDGFPIFSPYHSGESFSAWNPDALASTELVPTAETWDALSGVVAASSRSPGAAHHAQTGFSTTQARFTLYGPVGTDGAGYLWSYRSAFPGFPAPQRDHTYLRSETGDQLVKLEVPVGSGGDLLRFLVSGGANELSAAGPVADEVRTRNTFDWENTTIGAAWRKPLSTEGGGGSLELRAWSAGQNADAAWHLDSASAERLTTYRRDAGLAVTLERLGNSGRTAAGLRLQSSKMAYQVTSDSAGATRYRSMVPLVALFVERNQRLGSHVEVHPNLGATSAASNVRISPRLWIGWSPSPKVGLAGGYLRLYQFAQSLRNPESVAAAVFPVDLFVGSGKDGVPIARSDEGIVSAQYAPGGWVHVTAQGYVRSFRDIVLVAPRNPDPFTSGGFAIGEGTAHGFAIDLARTTPHYSAFASYGRQFVQYRSPSLGQRYVPDFAATDLIDAGIMVNAARMLSLRAGASGRFGRRGTALATPFEWESCNVADRGCEFAGTPRSVSDSLGATALPGYVRFDIGVRSHWQVRIAGRTTDVSLFGTVTNVFARTNILTVAPDPVSGIRAPVTLRSRVPLVLGVDWAF